ncbi:MAG: RIP metalloprotease RseP [bacterium]
MTLLIFLLVLSLLVLFHECGHYLTARLFGCAVEEFGFGFPPRAWGFKKGKTLWSLNWIPLGGFVKIKGESEEANEQDSFFVKPLWQKAIILVAGVFMNLVLALLLFWIGYISGFPMAVEGLPSDAAVSDRKLMIEQVVAGSPADKAGIAPGYSIKSANGTPVLNYGDFIKAAQSDKPGTVEVEVVNGETRVLKIEKKLIDGTARYGIGVGLVETGVVSYGPIRALVEASKTTYAITVGTFAAFGDLISGIFRGRGVGEVSGPIGIAVITGQVAKLGFMHLLQFAAMLSINLAVLNIVPFPALDGGRLLFVAIAAARGRKVAAKIENVFHTVGFFLLMLLVAVITLKDVARYGAGILGGLKGLVGM